MFFNNSSTIWPAASFKKVDVAKEVYVSGITLSSAVLW